ncbi:synaptotagmin-15-like [Centruroides sculpturatus]|uniref:synaptotagmin-15-like n=1 Tax=Centruroides sculpturatus TaxID=218467 RepID=UPI000C6E0FAC|nr:synaptotagmin-15-like [Centruroides sculpturatus]
MQLDVNIERKYIWIIIGGCLSAAIGIILLIVLILYLRKRTFKTQSNESDTEADLKKKRLSSAYSSSGDDADQSLSYQILARSFSTEAAIPYKMNSECVQPCHPTLTRWHSFNSTTYPPTFLGTVQPDLYRESDDEDTTIPTGMNGRLWFSLYYRSDAQELDVNLVKAKHLSGRGLNNTSRDPYVRIYLLPDEENYLQSKVRKRTLSPKFNEKFTFKVEESDLCNRTLRFSIYDVDKRKVRHTLGHVMIPLDKVDLSSNMLIWRDLESSALQTPTIRGEIQITLSCNPINGRIKTTVCRVRNIQGIDSGEAGKKNIKINKTHSYTSLFLAEANIFFVIAKSCRNSFLCKITETRKFICVIGRGLNNTSRDPYVRIYLLPDEENYLQSKVRKRTLSPKFNEKFTFKVEESDLCNRTLRFSIYDVDKRKVRHTLGHVMIPLDKVDLSSNMLIWRDLESSALQTPTIRGEIQITLSCNPINGRIKTTVCRVRNIQGIDSGEAGIYTRVLLYHGRKQVKSKRTSLQHFNPAAGDVIFDESFAFAVSGRFFDSCSFEFVVVVAGQSPLVKDEILGHVVIGPFMYARGEQLLHWQEMLTNQRSPVTKWHGLEAILEP